MNRSSPLSVRVSGELACFTRPELKAERVSYPIMTPSAARGILEAILWKPEMRWQIHRIGALRRPRWVNVRRNEVSNMAVMRSVQEWARTGSGGFDAEADRDQRNTLALRDVVYVIEAWPLAAADSGAEDAKYRDQFRRRVERGQCYSQPFLGCREFSAAFGPADVDERPVDWDEPLGVMFFGFDYSRTPRASQWFDARVQAGFLTVPDAPLADNDAERG